MKNEKKENETRGKKTGNLLRGTKKTQLKLEVIRKKKHQHNQHNSNQIFNNNNKKMHINIQRMETS